MTTTSTTTTLPRGIYRIVVGGGGIQLKRLTHANPVTIAPPIDGIRQEWEVDFEQDGTITISPVTPVLQVPYLSYKGAPAKPKAGELIVLQGTRHNPPPNKWRLRHTSLNTAIIHVDGSDLGIAVAPPDIIPPILDLKDKNQLEWRFEFVRA